MLLEVFYVQLEAFSIESMPVLRSFMVKIWSSGNQFAASRSRVKLHQQVLPRKK